MRYLVVLVVLAGCTTQAERQQRDYEAEQARARAYTQQVDGQCRSYGFKDGTPEFRDCVMRVDTANRQQWEAQRQMLLQQYIQQQGIFRPMR